MVTSNRQRQPREYQETCPNHAAFAERTLRLYTDFMSRFPTMLTLSDDAGHVCSKRYRIISLEFNIITRSIRLQVDDLEL